MVKATGRLDHLDLYVSVYFLSHAALILIRHCRQLPDGHCVRRDMELVRHQVRLSVSVWIIELPDLIIG